MFATLLLPAVPLRRASNYVSLFPLCSHTPAARLQENTSILLYDTANPLYRSRLKQRILKNFYLVCENI